MAFVVIYDACVLHPAPLRDLLMRVAHAGLVRARWSERILDETFDSIRRVRPHLDDAALDRTRARMNAAVRDAVVTGYESLVDGLDLPDPNDRHVLAAGIRAGAQTIVTANLRDFPAAQIEPYGIEAQHPDEFILDLIDLASGAVAGIVMEQAAALKNPPQTTADVLERLREQGLVRSVARLRELLGTVGQ